MINLAIVRLYISIRVGISTLYCTFLPAQGSICKLDGWPPVSWIAAIASAIYVHLIFAPLFLEFNLRSLGPTLGLGSGLQCKTKLRWNEEPTGGILGGTHER